MARWRQVWDEEKQKHVLMPIDEAAAKRDGVHDVFVRGDFDAFVSPVDGAVIRNHRQLEEHNRRNNVVSSSEFSQDYYDRKAKERERVFKGEHTTAENFARKQQLNEIINQLERRDA